MCNLLGRDLAYVESDDVPICPFSLRTVSSLLWRAENACHQLLHWIVAYQKVSRKPWNAKEVNLKPMYPKALESLNITPPIIAINCLKYGKNTCDCLQAWLPLDRSFFFPKNESSPLENVCSDDSKDREASTQIMIQRITRHFFLNFIFDVFLISNKKIK